MNAAESPRRSWQAPAPSLAERAQTAVAWAFTAAVILSVAFVLLALLVVGVDRYGGQDSTVSFTGLLSSAGILFVVLFVVLCPTLLLLSTRQRQDRAFTVAGFLATFFGLAMLVVFFGQLILGSHIGFGVPGSGVLEWFEYTPRLIEEENRRLLSAPVNYEKDELAKLEDERRREIAKAEQEVADDPASKDLPPAELAKAKAEARELVNKVFDEDVIPPKKKDIELNVAGMRKAAERDLRHDTSAPSILWHFLTHGPSDAPQEAGIWPALLGSIYVGLITLIFAVPVGVGAAIYLEEYRADSRLSRLIQVNINNLAGVPSVVYGILGGFVFVELIFKPLSDTPGFEWIAARNVLGGGLTLGLLTLPIVIVSAQEAIRAVPNSIRQGAYALGATKWQTIWRTVLPIASPGILTGTILSLSRAIGEAAPLILFGALLFVNQDPSLFSRFTILPMQIFGWADYPAVTMENGESVDIWKGNAAMASLVLLLALLALNGVAIWLRNRAQKRTQY